MFVRPLQKVHLRQMQILLRVLLLLLVAVVVAVVAVVAVAAAAFHSRSSGYLLS